MKAIHCLRRLVALCLLCTPLLVLADAPVVGAKSIVEALGRKDIVLDQPGRAQAAPSINLNVQFAFNSAQLEPQGRTQLDQLAMAFQDKALASGGFELAGHTDKVGSAAYNQRLSRERAEAVKAYLAEVHHIGAERLQAVGYGFARLLDPANPGDAVNRRVEVRRIAAPKP